METIKIRCTSGITIPFENLKIYPSKLKKHSILEVERIVESILEDGFLFPLAVGKVKENNYIIDGEATYEALSELKSRGYELPEIPIFYVRCKEESIKKMILIGTSTNHCVTMSSLEDFVKDTEFKNELKNLSFNEGTLLDFWTVADLDRIFEKYKRERPKALNGSEDYVGLLADGEI